MTVGTVPDQLDPAVVIWQCRMVLLVLGGDIVLIQRALHDISVMAKWQSMSSSCSAIG